ncbi:MAG: 1,4-dihydroxy-2-naphthoate polyprenyltransferase [Myxococcales bacterium]|nr:1,4-dihydroxy-2-naphthoate polyprenyltransferase [Myxococcales bacterium]
MSDAVISTEPRGGLRAWILASRPATLTAAVVPVAVGTAVAVAVGGFRLLPALAALFGAICIQIGTNFANDVFDYEKGADTEARLGPTRAVQAGLLSAGQVRVGMYVVFGLAVLAGLYLTWVGGWVVVAIGVLSILSGVLYTAGPYPLAYLGLGDVFVMIFFGFVAVMGTTYVQTLSWPALGWWASVPVGALSTGVLVVNNVRDRLQDVHANKRTLPVRFGRRFAEVQYILLMLAAYAVPVALWATKQAGLPVLLPLVTLPVAARLTRDLFRLEGKPLNATLAGTAKLLLLFGALFAGGLVA